MTSLTIQQGKNQSITVTISKNDKHSNLTFLKVVRNDSVSEETTNCNEMILGPAQLEEFGNFLINQAKQIYTRK